MKRELKIVQGSRDHLRVSLDVDGACPEDLLGMGHMVNEADLSPSDVAVRRDDASALQGPDSIEQVVWDIVQAMSPPESILQDLDRIDHLAKLQGQNPPGPGERIAVEAVPFDESSLDEGSDGLDKVG